MRYPSVVASADLRTLTLLVSVKADGFSFVYAVWDAAGFTRLSIPRAKKFLDPRGLKAVEDK